jgi:hypothetical protein
MKHRPIDVPPNDAAKLVHDVLELAELCVKDLRRTSEAVEAPGEVIKMSELAHVIRLLDDVRVRHQPSAPPQETRPLAERAADCLTKQEAAVLDEVQRKITYHPPLAPLQEPESGMAADLQAICEMEISRLLAQARESAWGLLRPQELVSLLELCLRLPPPPPEAPLVPDISALTLEECRFLLYVQARMKGEEQVAEQWATDRSTDD